MELQLDAPRAVITGWWGCHAGWDFPPHEDKATREWPPLTLAVCDPRDLNTHPSPLPPHQRPGQHSELATWRDYKGKRDIGTKTRREKTGKLDPENKTARVRDRKIRGQVRRETETVRDAGPERQRQRQKGQTRAIC